MYRNKMEDALVNIVDEPEGKFVVSAARLWKPNSEFETEVGIEPTTADTEGHYKLRNLIVKFWFI